ncbi:MAG: hypothetical protein UT32_C0010G0012 [Parcubacteria group bacterium GW2011_GWC2_39_14]|nr:MAG: hypothetical protein UT32_C0010G0012 [Parcubacteria group bacterium GW2011_GWC2_39_14]KKR55161.1 MAG: hypothetical protein UT91_C0004G0060 [Parcubacteria group bacterium GW2011_GWA2_40_23]
MRDSKFWLVKSDEAAKDAVKRFEATNKYFRTLTAEGKMDSAKWDKESARYLAWMEATAQVSIAERLKTEYSRLNELTSKLDIVPNVPGSTTADLLKAINKKYDIAGSIIIQKNIIETLQISFAEHQLNMEEFDAKVAVEDADIAKQKEREAGFAEARAAYKELDEAELALEAQRAGFLKGARYLFGFKTKEQKEAAARVKTAKKAAEPMYDKHYMGTGKGASSALASYRERQAQFQEDMRHAGGLYF